jgi:hypothetical protein
MLLPHYKYQSSGISDGDSRGQGKARKGDNLTSDQLDTFYF